MGMKSAQPTEALSTVTDTPLHLRTETKEKQQKHNRSCSILPIKKEVLVKNCLTRVHRVWEISEDKSQKNFYSVQFHSQHSCKWSNVLLECSSITSLDEHHITFCLKYLGHCRKHPTWRSESFWGTFHLPSYTYFVECVIIAIYWMNCALVILSLAKARQVQNGNWNLWLLILNATTAVNLHLMAQFTCKTRFYWPSNIYLGLRTAGTNTFVCMLADRQQMKRTSLFYKHANKIFQFLCFIVLPQYYT